MKKLVKWFPLCVVLSGCGQPPKSEAVYDNNASKTKLASAGDFLTRGRLPESLADAIEAEKLDPTWSGPYIAQADIQSRSAHFREAQEILLKGHEKLPKDVELTVRLLDNTQAFFPPAKAEQIAREALKIDPSRSELHFFLGQAISNSGDQKRNSEALQEFNETLKLNPSMVYALIEIGKLNVASKSPASGIPSLEAAAAILDGSAREGKVSEGEFEQWVKDRRTVVFWQSQSYLLLKDQAKYKSTAKIANKLGKVASLIRTLKVRASATPPDEKSAEGLKAIYRAGTLKLIVE